MWLRKKAEALQERTQESPGATIKQIDGEKLMAKLRKEGDALIKIAGDDWDQTPFGSSLMAKGSALRFVADAIEQSLVNDSSEGTVLK